MQQETIRTGLRLAAALLTAAALLPGIARADTKVRVSSFEYDASGLLVKEVVEPDLPNDCLQTTYAYDGYGNKTGATTATCAGASGDTLSSAGAPRATTTTYGADGRFPVSSTNAIGHSETRAFDTRFGTVTSILGPNGLTTSWEYDGFGRKTRETRSDGTYTTWAYRLCSAADAACPAPIGGAASVWVAVEQSYSQAGVASAPQKRQYHDALNRVVRMQTTGFDGAGAGATLVQDTEYDSLGRVARKSQLYALAGGNPNWTTFTYDVLGRMLSESSPDAAASGGVATSTVSYNGLVSTVTNSKGQTKTTHRNAQGLVAQVVDHQGNTVAYTYDALGQITQTNAAGSITTIAYDRRGRKIGMVDPAMGKWQYAYNAFGELVRQTDGLGRSTTLAYDALGRQVLRTEPDLVSQWSFDRNFDGSTCGKGVGKLCEAKSDNGYKRRHHYDALGRAASTATVLDNAALPATVTFGYDVATGRLATKTFPTGYQAGYQYTPAGFLKKVTGGGSGGFTQTVTFEVTVMDAKGHITQYKQGNQVTTVRDYDDATGRLKSQSATRNGFAAGGVLAQTYGYDSLGNLVSRTDNSPAVGTQESFSYDVLNRLSMYTILGGGLATAQSTQVLYDARGNIQYKSDVGRYWYDPQRPNRLTNITLETAPGAQIANTGTRQLTYAFDDYLPGAQTVNGVTLGNGNLMYTVSQDTANNLHTYRGETYTSFNMPQSFTYSNFVNGAASTADRTLTFVYGPEHQRIRQQVELSANAPTSYSAGVTWYLHGESGRGLTYEKEIKANGLTEHKHYVEAAGMVFALFVSREGNLAGQSATTIRYFHNDHLGSLSAISDENGQVVERLAYDPWGKRRNVNGTQDVLDSIVGWNTDRGFTMHEHLDEMGIIHMNGRVYDPLVGRFMSADPTLQFPYDLRSFNRYSYVHNNPLSYFDADGYGLWTKIRKTVVRAVAAVADAFGCSGFCSAAVGAYYGAKNGGGFAGAVVGAVGGYLGSQYGGGLSIAGGAINAAVGCASAAVSGDSCGRGAVASTISYVGGQYGLVGTAAAGCVNGVIMGGKCGQGARHAALDYAVSYGVQQSVSIYIEARRELEQQQQASDTYRSNSVACGPDCAELGRDFGGSGLLTTIPLIDGRAMWSSAKRLWLGMSDTLASWVFSTDAANDKPSTLQPGPHAGESIPARGPDRDFTGEERDEIDRIGRETGCHTCGSKDPGTKGGRFVPDHQSPNALNPDDAPQRLYPHCLRCSRQQGGEVRGKKYD